VSQLAAPPDSMMRPTLGEQLDARLDRDAVALTHLADRIAMLAATLAVQSTQLADARQALAHLQRRVGRLP
jgi:hypothetical protein